MSISNATKLFIRFSLGKIGTAMPYTQSLSSENPGYIVILIDQSGSMMNSFGGATGGTKAEECAKAVNNVLQIMILSCTKGFDIKNRCDISVLSYGASGNTAKNAFNGDLATKLFVTIQDLSENCLKYETVKMKEFDGFAETEFDEEIPIWIEPVASDGTPMAAAFEMAYDLIDKWTKSHEASFPPIVINITDGEPDSKDEAKIAALKLTQTGTNDGNTLIINIHISEGSSARVELPSSDSDLPPRDDNAKFLFDFSSELPPVMIERAKAKGYNPKVGAKGFVYNADAKTMINLLDIGTKTKLQ